MLSEHYFEVTVVVTLLITTILQVFIHAATWWALGPQPKTDRIAFTLRQREGAMSIKGFGRSFFEFVLVLLVIDDRLPFTRGLREVIYVVSATLAVYALIRSVQFVLALRKENWGRPTPYVHERKEKRDERQDAREDGLDERAIGLDERGWDMSKESIEMEVRNRTMDRREDALNIRDKE